MLVLVSVLVFLGSLVLLRSQSRVELPVEALVGELLDELSEELALLGELVGQDGHLGPAVLVVAGHDVDR